MGVKQAFLESKEKILACWPADRIIERGETKIVLQCENGLYLVYRYIKLPDDPGLAGLADLMDDKIMFQVTDDLDKQAYTNISAEIAGKRKATGKITEVIKELSVRLQVGETLE